MIGIVLCSVGSMGLELTDGLVSCWEGNNNNSYPDAIGSYDGTIYGATYTSSAHLNGGYIFDGIDDYIRISGFPQLTDDLTVLMWVKDSTSDDGMGIGNDWYLWIDDTGGDILHFNDGSGYLTPDSNSGLADSQFHQTGFKKTGGQLTYIIDGSFKDTVTSTADLTWSDSDLYIGTRSDESFNFEGTIDQVCIWNRTLSSTEISTAYNNGTGTEFDIFTTSITSPSNASSIQENTPYTLNFTFDQTKADDDIIDCILKENGTQINSSQYNISASGENLTISKTFTSEVYYDNIEYQVFCNDSTYNSSDSVTLDILMDDTNPTINFTNPLENNSTKVFDNITLNISMEDNLRLFNASVVINYPNGTLLHSNYTDYINTTTWTFTDFLNLSDAPAGIYTSIAKACDGLEEELNCKTTNFAFTLMKISTNYSTPVYEDDDTAFSLLFEFLNITNSSTATLIYNNTEYPGLIDHTNNSYVEFTANVTIPWVYANNTAISFSWNYSLEYANGSSEDGQTAAESHTVLWNLSRYPRVNVSLIEFYTNSSISTFSILTDYGSSFNTTSGSINVPILENNLTVINISSSGYSSLLDYNLTTSSGYEYQNITMYTFNSIRLNIFNESSMGLLAQNVTIHTISDVTSFTNSTTSGFIIIDFLAPNSYELRFESDGFNPISKFITVLNDSTNNISIYMTENVTELQVIEILDTANQPVENAIVWLQKEIIGSPDQFITIQEAQTNYDGQTTVWVERDLTTYYRFAVIYEGESKPIQPSGNLFTGKTYFIPGVDETIQLIIDITGTPTDFISDRYAVSTDLYFGGVDNNTVFYEFVDGRNSISGARLVIKGKYIGNLTFDYELISDQEVAGTSGMLNYTFIPINNTIYQIEAYIIYDGGEELAGELIKRFEADVVVDKNTGLLYAVILLVVVALVTIKFGPLVSGSITFASLFAFNLFGLTDIPTSIITTIIAFIIIVFGKTRKQ